MAAMFVAKNWRSADAWSSAGSEASVVYAFASSADGENCTHEQRARTGKCDQPRVSIDTGIGSGLIHTATASRQHC